MSNIEHSKIKVDELFGEALDYAVASALKLKVEFFDDAFLNNGFAKSINPDYAKRLLSTQPMKGKFCLRDSDGLKLLDLPKYHDDVQAAYSIVTGLQSSGLRIDAQLLGGWAASLKGTDNFHVDTEMHVAALKCFVEKCLGNIVDVPSRLIKSHDTAKRMKI